MPTDYKDEFTKMHSSHKIELAKSILKRKGFDSETIFGIEQAKRYSEQKIVKLACRILLEWIETSEQR